MSNGGPPADRPRLVDRPLNLLVVSGTLGFAIANETGPIAGRSTFDAGLVAMVAVGLVLVVLRALILFAEEAMRGRRA